MIYAIGDIHGESEKLRRLLEQILPELAPEDTLLFLGDYIDRGPDTRGALDTLIALSHRHANLIFLRGNHEQMFLDALESPTPRRAQDPEHVLVSAETAFWMRYGGANMMRSYDPGFFELPQDVLLTWWTFIPEEHIAFLRRTQIEHVTKYYHFVHAGLVPPGEVWYEALNEPGRDPRQWIYAQFIDSPADFGRIVVYGHSSIGHRPRIQDNKIGLDTRCGSGGPLTAAAFDPSVPPRRPFAARIFQAK
jgi:serine/threonine protein phosphatase 1